MSLRFLVYGIFILPMFGFVTDASHSIVGGNDPCDRVKISIEVSETGGGKYRADVTVTGAKEPIRYFFSDDKDLLNTNYTLSSMEFHKKGKYTCLVRDAGGCRKLTEFEVK